MNIIRKYWRNIFIVLTLSADSAAVLASAWTAMFVREIIPGSTIVDPGMLTRSTIIYGIILLGAGLLNGLYRAAYHSNLRQQAMIAGRCYIQSLFIILSLLYLIGLHFPRRFTLLFFVILPLIFAIVRYLIFRISLLSQRWGLGLHNVLIIGADKNDVTLFRRFRRFPELGYNIKGVVSKDQIFLRNTRRPAKRQKTLEEHFFHDFAPAFSLSELEKVVKRERIDRAFIPSLDLMKNGFSEIFKICANRGIKLKILSNESEDLLRFSRVRDIAGVTIYAPPRQIIDRSKALLKRIFDIVASAIALVLVSPILIAVAIAVIVEDGRPILFKQRRALAKGGKSFIFYKFRSMVKGAETRQRDLYRFNKRSGGLFLMEDDPRLTRVGRFIRRYSIDELPQILNVLKGNMSLVGPRPLSLADLENLDPENELSGFYRLRGQSKPGITGLWQVSGRREVGFKEMVLLDLYYIENQTLLFDLEILFSTVPVVLFGRGAY